MVHESRSGPMDFSAHVYIFWLLVAIVAALGRYLVTIILKNKNGAWGSTHFVGD